MPAVYNVLANWLIMLAVAPWLKFWHATSNVIFGYILGIEIFDVYIYVLYAGKHGAFLYCRPLMYNSGEQYIFVGDISLIYMPNI